MTEWVVKEHPDFFRDLDKLGTKELTIFYREKARIKQNPLRLKHLSGGENCYREPVTKNVRLIYALKGNVIWLLTIVSHDDAYADYLKRLRTLKEKLSGN